MIEAGRIKTNGQRKKARKKHLPSHLLQHTQMAVALFFVAPNGEALPLGTHIVKESISLLKVKISLNVFTSKMISQKTKDKVACKKNET